MNVKEPRAKYAGCHWSTVLCPPLPLSPSLQALLPLLQRSYTPLSNGLWRFPFRLLTNWHSGVWGCFCWFRCHWLDVADVFINSTHFPLPFLHHCGASCLCADRLLHWCVEKSGSQSDSVQEQVPAVVQIIQRFWQDWIFEWQHLQAANFERSSLLMLIPGQHCVDQMASNKIWPK